MYELGIKRSFSAAHQLRGYQGKCEALHGHTFAVEVRVRAAELDALGLAVDFKDLKTILDRLLDQFDHRYLNEITPFDRINPSSEHLAREIYLKVKPEVPAGVSLVAVKVWESEEAWAEYGE